MQPLKRHAVVDFALREFRELPKAACANACPNSWHSDRSNRIQQHSPFQSTLPRSGGAGSKLFCRVRRLQQVLMLAGKTQMDWADIAFFGCFDQAHLISTFGRLRITPAEYLAQRGFHPCHVVLPD